MTASLTEHRRRRSHNAAGPVILVLAGPNGAGKSTFYEHFLADTGLPFVNADLIARELRAEQPVQLAYKAAQLADEARRAFVAQKKSFCMETVFSDPIGDKLAFLQAAQQQGYMILMNFIGLAGVELSIARAVQRTGGGGHDVPDEKLIERFPRTLKNLQAAIPFVDLLMIYDNSSATAPYRHLATFERGKRTFRSKDLPPWAASILR